MLGPLTPLLAGAKGRTWDACTTNGRDPSPDKITKKNH
jgi:hypothetical protein